MKNLFLLLSLLLSIVGCSEFEESINENPTPNANNETGFLQGRLCAQNNNFFPINFDSNIALGMTGHPFTQEPYSISNISDQVSKLKEHGCNFYRFELNPTVGSELGTTLYPSNLVPFTSQNITVLPVIAFNIKKYPTLTLQELENAGMNIGTEMLLKLGNLPYYEVGNELSIGCLKTEAERLIPPISTFEGGNKETDYDGNRIDRVAAMMRGIISVLPPSSKIVTSNGGYLQNHYFKLLENRGVDIDVIGVHWYSNMGIMSQNIIAPNGNSVNSLIKLETYNKPIWITEFGFYEQTRGAIYDPKEKSQYLIDFINDLHNHPKIQGLFFYQMYFQKLLFLDTPNVLNFNYQAFDPTTISNTELNNILLWHQNERNYGLFDSYTNTYNLQSDAFKYKIEEIKFGYDDFVYELYNRLFFLTDNPSMDITYHVTALKNSQNKDNTINAFFTADRYYKKFIRTQYKQLLDTPNPLMGVPNDGVGYWEGQMTSGLTREGLIINFCSVEQFWKQSGETAGGFIDRLYLKLLKRPSDSNGKSQWLTAYNLLPESQLDIVKRQAIASSFIKTEEYFDKFVKQQYNDLLSRTTPEVAGVNYWVTQMKAPINMSQVDVMKNFVKSEGFLERSIFEGYKRRNYPFDYHSNEALFYL